MRLEEGNSVPLVLDNGKSVTNSITSYNYAFDVSKYMRHNESSNLSSPCLLRHARRILLNLCSPKSETILGTKKDFTTACSIESAIKSQCVYFQILAGESEVEHGARLIV